VSISQATNPLAALRHVRRCCASVLCVAIVSTLAFVSETATSAESSAGFQTKDCRSGLALFPANRELIDPELLPVLATLTPTAPRAPGMAGRREGFLEGFKKRQSLASPPPADVEMHERHVPSVAEAPPVRVLVYTPKSKSTKEKSTLRPALLDIHGGSFVLGFPEMNDARNRMLSHDLDAVVVSIDYRLAPEHPFPAAMDDSYAALEWLHDHAMELEVDPTRIAVSGDSAGGGIAASLALMARDKGKVKLKAQILIYPAVDDRPFTSMDPSCADGTAPPFNAAFAPYLGKLSGQKDIPSYAFAARAQSLANLPPTFIAVGALDGLSEQGLIYAQRLISANVPTEVHVYPGAYHGFDMTPNARVTQQFYDDLRRALHNALK